MACWSLWIFLSGNGTTFPWTSFVTHLVRFVRGHDSIWVIVDKLMKCAHFLLINQKMFVDKLADLYVREVVGLHRVPTSIVSDRYPRFTSRFS